MNQVALSLAVVLLSTTTTRADEPDGASAAPNCSPLSLSAARLEARKLLDDAEQAGSRKSRLRSLEAAYRLYQNPLILYNLGMLWQSAGRRVEAADLFRRYLYEADSAVSPERRDRLSRFLGRVGQGLGELELSSEPCAFIYLDGRLVGRAPLSLPLLLRPGRHVVEVEKDHRKRRMEIGVYAGQRALAVRLPSTAVLLSEGAAEAVAAAADGAIAEAGLTPIAGRAREAILQGTPRLRGCLSTLPCQEELAQLLSAQYLLHLQVAPEAGKLSLRLLDADAAAWSVAQEAPCPGCTEPQLAQRALELARAVLRDGLARGRGTLQITSVPEADVIVDGRRVGRTPLLRTALAGEHSVAVLAPGYVPHRARVEVEDGRRVVVDAALVAEAGPPPAALRPPPPVPAAHAVSKPSPEGPSRPRWRLGLGGAATGVGAGLITLGALALAVHGQCGPAGVPMMPVPGAPCDRVYETQAPGGAMLGTGAVLLLAGVLTAAWPAVR